MIYFDNAATTKMSRHALTTYEKIAENYFANSESLHRAGTEAGYIVKLCRRQIAERLDLDPDGIVFTSGGTESNQLGIRTLLGAPDKREILVSPLEHASIYQLLEKISRTDGCAVRVLPIDAQGHVTPDTLAAAITAHTALIVVQAVNAVTGIRQPTAALSQVAQTHHVSLFVDAVQAMGKVPLTVAGLAGFSVSAHKFNGPKGCGFLYLSPEVETYPQFADVFQQSGFLAGTLDVPAIASMTTALQDALDKLPKHEQTVERLRRELIRQLAPSFKIVDNFTGYAGILGMILPHTPGQEAATELGRRGYAISTVSACSLRDPRPDRTLTALQLAPQEIEHYIRISFGDENTPAEAAEFAAQLNQFYA